MNEGSLMSEECKYIFLAWKRWASEVNVGQSYISIIYVATITVLI